MVLSNKIKLLVAALAFTGGGAFAFYKFFNGSELTPTEGANLIPQQALMTAYINTDSQDWSKLKRFGTPELQSYFANQLVQLNQQFKFSDNINYAQDLEPWVGNAMVAVLPSGGTAQPNLLVVVGIKNKLKALEFFNKVKEAQKSTTPVAQYQGVDIFEIKNPSQAASSMLGAVWGDHLLLADKRATIEQGIDIAKGKPSLLSKEGVKNFYAQNLSLKNTLVKVYIPDYVNVATQEQQNIPPEIKTLLPKSMIIGMGVEDQGIHFQSLTNLNPQAPKQTIKSFDAQLLKKLPSETLAVVNGKNMKESWAYLVKEADKILEVKQSLQQIRASFQSLNFDLDKDIFGWLDQEYAFALISSPQVPTLNMGTTLILETSDRPTGENTFNKFQQLLQAQGGFISISQNDVQGKKVTEYGLFGQQIPPLQTGWINDKTAVITFGTPFQSFVNPQGNKNLTETQNFIDVTKPLPKNNLGYIYIDMEKGGPWVKNMMSLGGTIISPETNNFLNSLTAIAATATFKDDFTNQGDLLLGLKVNK